jgi:transcriptional regulator with XRE-family HTH domain
MPDVAAGAGARRAPTPDQLAADIRRTLIPGAIFRARKQRHWSQGKLAEMASAQPGAPLVSKDQVDSWERGRPTVRLDAASEPLVWIFRALALPGKLILEALGMAA